MTSDVSGHKCCRSRSGYDGLKMMKNFGSSLFHMGKLNLILLAIMSNVKPALGKQCLTPLINAS